MGSHRLLSYFGGFWGGNFALLVCPLLFGLFFPQFFISLPSSVIILLWL